MFAFSSLERTFHHGVHPMGYKEQTADLAIQRVPFVEFYTLPVAQHIGIPAKPIVEVGQTVERGQCVALANGVISTALHSPVKGVVNEIGMFRYIDGSFKQAIRIKIDALDAQNSRFSQIPKAANVEEFITQVQQAGIVGLGGAAFPSHVKYDIPQGQQIEHILINGAECEPFLTNDHRLMVEHPLAVLNGGLILAKMLCAKKISIGIEKNKPESIQAIQQQLTQLEQQNIAIEIVPLEVKYPQGAEKMLIKSVYGLELEQGKLPRDLGIVVNNVGTIVALDDYFNSAMPVIERIITVAGPGVSKPANLRVPIGTPIRDVLAFCGGLKPETREVIMGGPMMGTPIADLDAPIVKGTSGILAFTEKETAKPTEYPCIRCARCLEACPYFLNPSRFALLAKSRLFEEMQQKYQVMDCVECGACSYACPSNIPIVQLIRTAKDSLRHNKSH